MTENHWQSTFEFTEPDMGRIRLVGNVDHEELDYIFQLLEDRVATRPYFLLEVNMSDIKGASPEARRLAAQRLGGWQQHALAVVTTSFAGRMIAKLVLTANDLLNRGRTSSAFFKEGESAAQWLVSRREVFESEGKAPSP
jgi:hypothetical protein